MILTKSNHKWDRSSKLDHWKNSAEGPSGPGALLDGEKFTFHTPTVYIFRGDKDIWIILFFGCFT